mmetsp:Transcript_66751/g.195893  ORF Transcript_66751/g.195893 Transcript_66751/m.195893 type:complete len:228 (-) Transcript_66751:862-1545(-)
MVLGGLLRLWSSFIFCSMTAASTLLSSSAFWASAFSSRRLSSDSLAACSSLVSCCTTLWSSTRCSLWGEPSRFPGVARSARAAERCRMSSVSSCRLRACSSMSSSLRRARVESLLSCSPCRRWSSCSRPATAFRSRTLGRRCRSSSARIASARLARMAWSCSLSRTASLRSLSPCCSTAVLSLSAASFCCARCSRSCSCSACRRLLVPGRDQSTGPSSVRRRRSFLR